MKTEAHRRAPLSPELQALREELEPVFQVLDDPDWYASIYLERKSTQKYSVNLKQTQIADQVTLGAVLRIYDGYTLFEEATDDLDIDAVKRLAVGFVKRVRASERPAGVKSRPYHPLTWKQRLSLRLDSEISSQVPKGATARTPVHFGIRFVNDPTKMNVAQTLDGLKALLDQIKESAPSHGLEVSDLTYLLARQSFSVEEAIFIDRETRMSQALYRLALAVVTMSGVEQTVLRLGGLGGLEAIRITESEIDGMLRDLKALKSAERLKPGKYRVLFGPVLTGVLAHEAFGHAQEGDTCARGRSKAWELHKTGQSVGNEHATILNNPAVFENAGEPYAAWGSYYFDEEGWLAQEQVLLDKGVLRSPMTNLTSALRLGVARTANGKRESWANGVYTRQTNTYFSPGNHTLAQLLEMMGDGFVAHHPAGGMEDPKGMGIQVGISYLEEVKAGRLTGKLFKGPAGGDIQLTGYTPDILNSIVAKSKVDFDRDTADTSRYPFNDAGGCGKYHKEFVNAGCGGPYLLLDRVILG